MEICAYATWLCSRPPACLIYGAYFRAQFFQNFLYNIYDNRLYNIYDDHPHIPRVLKKIKIKIGELNCVAGFTYQFVNDDINYISIVIHNYLFITINKC